MKDAHFGVGNQVVSSAANFAFSLFLLRYLTVQDFGLYGIGFALLLFVGTLFQALFLLQMVVLLPSRDELERPRFAANILALMVVFCFAMLSFTAVGAGAIEIWTGTGAYAMAVGVAAAAYVLKEFYVRYCFCRADGAAHGMIIHGVLAFTLLIGGFLMKDRLSVEGAMFLYASANFAAAAVGHAMSGLLFQQVSVARMRSELASVFADGKWAVISGVVYTVRAQAHTIMLAAILGPVEVARVNAARLLVTPATLLIPALSQVALPRFAERFTVGGAAEIVPLLRRMEILLSAFAIVYALCLILIWPYAAKYILGAAYVDTYWLMIMWCVFSVFLVLRNCTEWWMQAMRKFREISVANTLTAALVLITSYILTNALNESGAIGALIVGEICLIFALRGNSWLILKKNSLIR